MQPLQMAEDLAAQIEHYLLPAPLHDVGLRELQQKAEQQQSDVHSGDLRNAGQRSWTEIAIEERMGFGFVGEVFIDGDFGQVRPEHISARLQHDGAERNRDLPAIGMRYVSRRFIKRASYAFPSTSSSWIPAMSP